MTTFQYRFEKILTFREQERNEIESEYQVAVDLFKEEATELYHLLKKKEEKIAETNEKMATGFQITQIHAVTRYLENLERQIEIAQQKVMKARATMNWYEERLLEKTIEVKKYEKMKEKALDQFRYELEQSEAQYLDELSTIKFHGRENGW